GIYRARANSQSLRLYRRKSPWICRLYPTFAGGKMSSFPGILPWQDTDCVNRVSVYASPRNDERPLIAALGIGWAEV
ncbi:hypothetical protein, partial [Agrobacterium rosae]|uniref:hypothetical protein n=1 Tax=Agrobacterium rosae TaxID=1972867 RepID=UPI001AECABE7